MNDRFWQVVKRTIQQSDCILHVIDARLGQLTVSPQVVQYCLDQQKTLIFVINKADLVPDRVTRKLFKKLNPSVVMSSTQHMGTKRVRTAISRYGPELPEIKVAVVGYPNVGKSAVINALRGRRAAKSSSRSGTTRGVQWVRISQSVLLLDTPGIIPLDTRDAALKDLIDSTNPDHCKDPLASVVLLLQTLVDIYGDIVYESLGVLEHTAIDEYLIEELARQKNRVKKGNEPDTEAVAKMLLRKWQKGTLLQFS